MHICVWVYVCGYMCEHCTTISAVCAYCPLVGGCALGRMLSPGQVLLHVLGWHCAISREVHSSPEVKIAPPSPVSCSVYFVAC